MAPFDTLVRQIDNEMDEIQMSDFSGISKEARKISEKQRALGESSDFFFSRAANTYKLVICTLLQKVGCWLLIYY